MDRRSRRIHADGYADPFLRTLCQACCTALRLQDTLRLQSKQVEIARIGTKSPIALVVPTRPQPMNTLAMIGTEAAAQLDFAGHLLPGVHEGPLEAETKDHLTQERPRRRRASDEDREFVTTAADLAQDTIQVAPVQSGEFPDSPAALQPFAHAIHNASDQRATELR